MALRGLFCFVLKSAFILKRHTEILTGEIQSGIASKKSRVEERGKRFSMITVPGEVVHSTILSSFNIICLKFSITFFF